jgi:hypothetical protein
MGCWEGDSSTLGRHLDKTAPPHRGFEPFHRYFSPESSQYPFKPNMKLLFALMPILAGRKRYPRLVLCPKAGVGAAPIMVLAYYRPPETPTKVITYEDDERWRRVLVENLEANYFCRGRFEVKPLGEVEDGVADASIVCIQPTEDAPELVREVSDLLEALHGKLATGSRVVLVSRRLEVGFDALYTELLLESAVNVRKYAIEEVSTVRGRKPQRRLYNEEAWRDVFVILHKK